MRAEMFTPGLYTLRDWEKAVKPRLLSLAAQHGVVFSRFIVKHALKGMETRFTVSSSLEGQFHSRRE